MRFEWQCPTCAAQIGNDSNAKMLTCPFCGSLLISDFNEKKFYLVKNERGWYFFSKKYLHGYTGYVKYGANEDYYLYRDGAWFLIFKDEPYRMVPEKCPAELSFDAEGAVDYVWGSVPLIAPPGTVIRTAILENIICKSTKKHIIKFEKTQNQG